MSDRNLFDIIILIARPAAGKSEIIDYLKKQAEPERMRRFHVGKFGEIDDFPMLWTWFEEDALLERMGHPRLHTDADGYFLHNYLWDLLIERIGLEYQKIERDRVEDAEPKTTIIEFSRGIAEPLPSPNPPGFGREQTPPATNGYRSAFAHLSRKILEKAVILYVDVSWEESLRKNRKRFNPEKPDSILEHSLPDEKLERLYKKTDWEELSSGNPKYLVIQGMRVPYAVFDNTDDVTTGGGEALGSRLEEVLNKLWTAKENRGEG